VRGRVVECGLRRRGRSLRGMPGRRQLQHRIPNLRRSGGVLPLHVPNGMLRCARSMPERNVAHGLRRRRARVRELHRRGLHLVQPGDPRVRGGDGRVRRNQLSERVLRAQRRRRAAVPRRTRHARLRRRWRPLHRLRDHRARLRSDFPDLPESSVQRGHVPHGLLRRRRRLRNRDEHECMRQRRQSLRALPRGRHLRGWLVPRNDLQRVELSDWVLRQRGELPAGHEHDRVRDGGCGVPPLPAQRHLLRWKM
jgi:hypothetical protein